jgi:hypothetical protein
MPAKQTIDTTAARMERDRRKIADQRRSQIRCSSKYCCADEYSAGDVESEWRLSSSLRRQVGVETPGWNYMMIGF